jgi:hypothetical protein
MLSGTVRIAGDPHCGVEASLDLSLAKSSQVGIFDARLTHFFLGSSLAFELLFFGRMPGRDASTANEQRIRC